MPKRKKDPFFYRLDKKLTDEQCCQLIAMRDVRGEIAAEAHFGIPPARQNTLSIKVKTRPDLDRIYWGYRNAMAKSWIGQLGETTTAVLVRISQEVGKAAIDPTTLRILTQTIKELGDIATSSMALAPELYRPENMPRNEVIDVDVEEDDDEDSDEDEEEEGSEYEPEMLLLEGSNGVS